MNLYICRDGTNVEGPFSFEELCEMVRTKQISRDVMTCDDTGNGEWQPLRHVAQAQVDLPQLCMAIGALLALAILVLGALSIASQALP